MTFNREAYREFVVDARRRDLFCDVGKLRKALAKKTWDVDDLERCVREVEERYDNMRYDIEELHRVVSIFLRHQKEDEA